MPINCSPIIKYLGAWLDQHMQLHDHIVKKCRTAMMNYTEDQVLLPIINPRICSHSGQRFSHLTSWLLQCNLHWVARRSPTEHSPGIQNITAKLVVGYNKYDSSITALQTLHWLPIIKRINFKILTLVHKCLSRLAPEYLKAYSLYTKVEEKVYIVPGTQKIWSHQELTTKLLWIDHLVYTDHEFGIHCQVTYEKSKMK